jgi:hypothetical protein
MKNLDTKSADLLAQAQALMKDGKEPEAMAAMMTYCQAVADGVKQDYMTMVNDHDDSVLQSRGAHTLTSQEKNYYGKLIEAMKSTDPKMAIANIGEAMPQTIIDQVMADVTADHPLLNELDFVNSSYLTKWILNAAAKQLAVWGPINSEITKELSGDLKVIDLTLMKLSAFMLIPQDTLELGPTWVDAYIRRILQDAAAYGIEDAVVNGKGLTDPIGMIRNVDGALDPTNGKPSKTATKIKSFAMSELGPVIQTLAKDHRDRPRTVPKDKLFLLVNPGELYSKVEPATYLLGPNGYIDVMPYGIRRIPCEAVTEGQAVLGISKQYFMGIGVGKDGKIESSDEYKFLEDVRTYKIRFFGNGMPKDNNSFALLDISAVKPIPLPVEVTNAADFPTA